MYKGMAADEDMTPTQIRQFLQYCLTRFFNIEEAYSQHAVGLLDETAYANLRASLKLSFGSPGHRAGWHMCRNQFDANGDFVAFVEGVLAETSATKRDLVTRCKESFAAENAAAVGG
jgi:hypothetical protein